MVFLAGISALPDWLVPTAAAVGGSIVGSFLGAVLIRLPQGRGVVTPRSSCDSCGRTLSPCDLIPILSFCILRGHCRNCQARIDAGHFLCELGGALVGLLPWLLIADPFRAGAAMVMGWLLLVLALLDWRHFWLPRRIVLLLALAGVSFAVIEARMFHAYADGLLLPLMGGVFGFSLLWLVRHGYRRLRGREGMGAGDAPLFGAIGLWIGPAGVVATLLGASLLGLFVALSMQFAGHRIRADTNLPLGTFLAGAGWAVFLLQGAGLLT